MDGTPGLIDWASVSVEPAYEVTNGTRPVVPSPVPVSAEATWVEFEPVTVIWAASAASIRPAMCTESCTVETSTPNATPSCAGEVSVALMAEGAGAESIRAPVMPPGLAPDAVHGGRTHSTSTPPLQPSPTGAIWLSGVSEVQTMLSVLAVLSASALTSEKAFCAAPPGPVKAMLSSVTVAGAAPCAV